MRYYKTKALAMADGKAVMKLIRDKTDWEIVVNLHCKSTGWLVRLQRGGLKLSWDYFDFKRPKIRSFNTLLSTRSVGDGLRDIAGEVFWSTNQSFNDPNIAIRHQMRIARRFIRVCQKTVKDAEDRDLLRDLKALRGAE